MRHKSMRPAVAYGGTIDANGEINTIRTKYRQPQLNRYDRQLIRRRCFRYSGNGRGSQIGTGYGTDIST